MADSKKEGVVFYWRPGCPFCKALEFGLKRQKIPVEKRNIWENPEYAATVRKIANGNETVPTLTIGGKHGMVNPSAKDVKKAVQKHAPHVLA